VLGDFNVNELLQRAVRSAWRHALFELDRFQDDVAVARTMSERRGRVF
jgi:hypothetical protein